MFSWLNPPVTMQDYCLEHQGFVFSFVVLGMQPRTWCTLSRCSTMRGAAPQTNTGYLVFWSDFSPMNALGKTPLGWELFSMRVVPKTRHCQSHPFPCPASREHPHWARPLMSAFTCVIG